KYLRTVGSAELETSSRTLPVVNAVIVANHRTLAVSKWNFGTLMNSVDETPKNESSRNVCPSPPCFVEIRPRTFTISTTWFGPTATCTSGGVSRIVNGPFVPKWSPSKPSTGTAASGGRGDGPAWTGRFRRSPAAARELTVGADVTCGSTGNVAWRRLSSRDWI